MLRGPYNTVSSVDRARLVKAFTDGQDWHLLAIQLGIKPKTAYCVIQNFQRHGRINTLHRGGNRPKALDEQMLNCVVDFVGLKPTATLEEMRVKLQEMFPDRPPVSLTTISRALDGQLITLKDVRTVPINWNQEDVKYERKLYTEWLLSLGIEENLIFCDEFGVNMWTARTKGRAVVGERAVRVVEGQRGNNLTICLAISPQWGLLNWKFVMGGFTREAFGEFVSELEALVPSPFILICDNARPHGDEDEGMEPQHHLHFLPRYSPFLNCAERAGSAMKSVVKKRLSDPLVQAEIRNHNLAHQLNQTLQGYRLNILRREMIAALQQITQAKCQNWFNQSMSYTQRCLEGADIWA